MNYLFCYVDPHGVVQRDLHNVNPDYLEYKFSYGTERNSKYGWSRVRWGEVRWGEVQLSKAG